MANSVALVVQAELLPPQSAASLSPFPSLLGSGEDGEDEGERGELEEGDKGVVEGGEEVVLDMVTSSVPGAAQQPKQSDHPFQCLDCGKSFRWSSRLTHHQRSHNNERPYRCNLCPKAFKGSSALLYHQRSHSGEKPYKCQDCGKAFKRSSLLQVHQSVHTGVRTFLCPYCPLTFKWSSHYQYHLRQHTGECPYPCDTCPKAFKNSSSLRRHKNVHLGLKPYTCSVCNKSFTQSTNLRQHMRIHTGERPYICGECGRSFTHSSNLALHKNSHSNLNAGGKEGKRGVDARDAIVEVVVGAEEMTSSMLTDMVGFVSQDGTDGVGVGMEEVFLSTTSSSQNPGLLPHLTLTPSGEGVCASRAIGTEVHLSTDTGASVLLYSCGSCSHTFGTQTDLEEHQAIHMAPEEHGAGGEAGPGAGMEVGDGLVGAGHLLADFEEVVETTTVVENGHTTEVLLGLTEVADNSNENVGATQAQFDLLQSFTEVTQSSETVQPEARTTWAGLSCGYCNKTFKTSGGLNRHVSLIHSLSSQSRSQFSCSACDRSFPLLSSLLTHQHSHTPEQRLLAEAEAEIVCPPSLSLSLPLPSSPSQADKLQEGQREIHVNIITVSEEQEEQPAKPAKAPKKTGASKSILAGVPTVDTSGPPSSVTVATPATTVATASVSTPIPATLERTPHTTVGQMRTRETVTGKQFVLCFDNEEQAKAGMNIEEGGESYVLQFEGDSSAEAVDGGMGGEGKSLVLQFKTDGQGEGGKGGDKGGMMSLLHNWGGEKHGVRHTGEESNQGESYVLHFHTEAQDSGPSSATFSQGQNNGLQLSCTPTRGLVPLDGQEMVFELGGESKMEQETEEGMQMIALIDSEGAMMGEDGAGCNAASGRVTEGGGAMENIFQLENGEEIVIIEVSTSSLREGGLERGGDGDISQSTEVKYETVAAEVHEKSVKEHNSAASPEVQTSTEDTMRNGPTSHSDEMQFSD
ncbi:hypothetical protein F2P81_002028 [Scophthalmus maximus]|uniref:C2H2-type domain-containing protein n=1 Tax=Scophthalmus maximus TaxID=52904 RepID=A0A6A4TKZ9_SCOMX|nr:hypothetical protein F2P81_002028 [Scophthalmus maximus]